MLDTSSSIQALRDPGTVMRLDRMGSMHQCRLSFMRILLRRLQSENWIFDRPVFEFDETGVGTAVYTAKGPNRTYSLICFGHDLKPEERSDRVIAHKWDSTFTLFDGLPEQADIDRLRQNVPKQEAGRVSNTELSVSRANRSVRLFEYVVDCLSRGKQPDQTECEAVGYLMRTTAVYGSGKLGAADREYLAGREEFKSPFQVEMLSVYLTRAYTLDLVEHVASLRSPETAIRLDPELRRIFGVGNSTGLGMAPFLMNHPVLLNNWVTARETALARVCALDAVSDRAACVFRDILLRARRNAETWKSEHPIQIAKIKSLCDDLIALDVHLKKEGLGGPKPWKRLYQWAEETLSLEGQEQLASLMIEPYGDLVDDLADDMCADESTSFPIQGAMGLDQLMQIIEQDYDWALSISWRQPGNQARIWYVSAEKLEPRMGERFREPVSPYEQPLAPGRDVKLLYKDLQGWAGEASVAAFLLRYPEHRHAVRRVQITARSPYAEIRDNTISQALLPVDMLRFKLAFFGATHFDPRSDRWVRINMFKHAPFPHELADWPDGDWAYAPVAGEAT